MNSWQHAAVGLSVWLSLMPTVYAQGALESRIRQLESRVERLEQANRTPSNRGASSESSKHRVRENWRALRKGMGENDVRDLLGDAHKIDTYTYFVKWYWGYPGGGDATFDGKTGLLQSWSEP